MIFGNTPCNPLGEFLHPLADELEEICTYDSAKSGLQEAAQIQRHDRAYL